MRAKFDDDEAEGAHGGDDNSASTGNQAPKIKPGGLDTPLGRCADLYGRGTRGGRARWGGGIKHEMCKIFRLVCIGKSPPSLDSRLPSEICT